MRPLGAKGEIMPKKKPMARKLAGAPARERALERVIIKAAKAADAAERLNAEVRLSNVFHGKGFWSGGFKPITVTAEEAERLWGVLVQIEGALFDLKYHFATAEGLITGKPAKREPSSVVTDKRVYDEWAGKVLNSLLTEAPSGHRKNGRARKERAA